MITRLGAGWGDHDTDADGHRWHSPSYVAEWISAHAQNASPEYHARHRQQLDTILRSIPHDRDARIAILDLGAGWGRPTRHLLEVFPNARAVALDFSRPMLSEARRNLAGYGARVEFAERDLEQPESTTHVGGPFDAVVSSETLHHIRTQRLAGLYGEIHAALQPGGAFVSVDRMQRRRVAWPAGLWHRLALGATGGTHAHGATRARHLRMLADVGFATRWEAVGNKILIVATKRTDAGRTAGPPAH